MCLYVFLLFQSEQTNKLGLRFFDESKTSRKSVKASNIFMSVKDFLVLVPKSATSVDIENYLKKDRFNCLITTLPCGRLFFLRNTFS